VLVVGSTTPYNSVKDLVRGPKAKPGDIKYASSGVGSTQHIAGEAFDLAAGIKTTHVPYKGSSQAHVDLFRRGADDVRHDVVGDVADQGRQVPAARGDERHALGRVAERADDRRSRLSRRGNDDWYGLFVTGGTPKAIVDQLTRSSTRRSRCRRPGTPERAGRRARQALVEQFAKMNRTNTTASASSSRRRTSVSTESRSPQAPAPAARAAARRPQRHRPGSEREAARAPGHARAADVVVYTDRTMLAQASASRDSSSTSLAAARRAQFRAGTTLRWLRSISSPPMRITPARRRKPAGVRR
jgi:hypothetical protein